MTGLQLRSMDQLVVRGKTARGEIADRILDMHVSLSAPLQPGAYATSQLTFTVADPDSQIWKSHLFDLGATVDLGTLHCRVADVEMREPAAGGEIAVTARSEGGEKLNNDRGPMSWANLSPSAVAVQLGEAQTLQVVAQPSDAVESITRNDRDVTVPGDRGESSFDMLARYGKALGFVVFEAYGVLYFGRPSWLVHQLPRLNLTWDPQHPPDDLLERPTCRRTTDNFGRDVRQVTLRVTTALAASLTPGMALDVTGIERFSTTYLISSIEFDVVDDGGEGTVQATLPTDPTVDPADAGIVASVVHTPLGPNQAGDAFGRFVNSIVGQESGGVYLAVNARTGALGRYQVLPANVGKWAIATINRTVTPDEFLHNPGLQDQIAVGMLWIYYRDHGPRGAAAIWYSGNVQRQNDYKRNPKFPNELSVGEYCDQVLARMPNASWVLPSGYTGAGTASTVVGGPKKSATLFLSYAQSQVEDHTAYKMGAKAAASVADPLALDCSGLTAWAAGRAGIYLPDGAHNQQQYCVLHKTAVGIEVAYKIPGALLFRLGTDPEHVAISMGDGRRTIEAMGRKYGVVDGTIANRGWNAAGLVPGLAY